MATNHVGGEGEVAGEPDLPEMVEYSTKITDSGTQNASLFKSQLCHLPCDLREVT